LVARWGSASQRGFESLFQAEEGQPVGQRESQSTDSDGNQYARGQVVSQRSYKVCAPTITPTPDTQLPEPVL
jgi:hypothetical protein